MVIFTYRIADITRFDCVGSVARWGKGELRVSTRCLEWKPTCISRIQVIKSTMTILRSLERPESWAVAAKKVKNSAVLGIRMFAENGVEERLIVKTTVRFLDHFVCPFI